MALRGTELILFVRAQNQASYTLRRIAGDVRALTHARDLQTRGERLALRQADLAARQQRNLRRMEALGPGGSRTRSLAARRVQLLEQELNLNNKIKSVRDSIARTETSLVRRQAAQIAIDQRVARTSPTSPRGQIARLRKEANLQEIANLNLKMDRYNEAIATAQGRIRGLDREHARLNIRYANQAKLLGDLATENEQLARKSRMLAQAQREVLQAEKLQRLERIQLAGRTASHIGRGAQFAGLVGTAALGFAASSAAQLNAAATRAATQTGPIQSGADVVVRNADRIQKAVIGMMTEIPAHQDQLTDVFYNIYSSMESTLPQGIKLAKLFGQVWVAGGMQGDINEVADALITLGNNWQIAASDQASWGRLAASTLATVRFARLDVQQYTQTMNQLAPAFHGANQSIDQMNGAIAFMTRQLPSSRMSAAGLARMMEILARFAAQPAEGFEGLAKAIQDAQGNLLPLDQILQIFLQRFPKLATSGVFLTNFFKTISGQQGTVQARRAFQVLIRGLQQYQDVLGQTTSDTGEFRRSLTAMEQSTGVRWAQFVNDIRAAVLELGTAVLPVFLKLGDYVSRAAKAFNNLSPEAQKTIGTIVAVTAVATLLGGVLLTVVGSLVAMGASLRILKLTRGLPNIGGLLGFGGGGAVSSANAARNVNTLTTAVRGLGNEAGAITTSGALKLGVIAAIPLLIKYHGIIGDISNALGGIGDTARFVGNVLGAFTLMAVVRWLLRSRVMADLLVGRLAVLRSTLLGLSGMRLAAIVIPLTIAWELGTNKNLQDALDKKLIELHDSVVGFFERHHMKGIAKVLDFDPTGELKRRRIEIQRNEVLRQTGGRVDMGQINRIEEGRLGEPTRQEITAVKRRWKEYDDAVKKFYQTPLGGGGGARQPVNVGPRAWQGWINKLASLKRAMESAQEAAPASVDTIRKTRAYLKAQDQLQKLLKDYPNLYSAIMDAVEGVTSVQDQSAKDAINHQEELADAARQAQDEIGQAASNLSQMYTQLRDQNQQAFGDLFQGPFIQSPFIQTGVEYGYQPNIDDFIKDLKAQRSQFNRFNGDLSAIARRGGPAELVKQLRNLGPDALDKIEQLRRAAPQKFQQFVTEWKKGQAAIERATKIDFNKQLKQWFRYGKGIAQQIIFGLRSENVALDNAMKKYITNKFPDYVDEAVRKAQRELDKQDQQTRTPKPKPKAQAGPTINNNQKTEYHITAPNQDVGTTLRKTKTFDKTHRGSR